MKTKLLPQSDVDEIARFQQHLADMQKMTGLSKTDFYRKYQKYLELSDAELASILEKEGASHK